MTNKDLEMMTQSTPEYSKNLVENPVTIRPIPTETPERDALFLKEMTRTGQMQFRIAQYRQRASRVVVKTSMESIVSDQLTSMRLRGVLPFTPRFVVSIRGNNAVVRFNVEDMERITNV